MAFPDNFRCKMYHSKIIYLWRPTLYLSWLLVPFCSLPCICRRPCRRLKLRPESRMVGGCWAWTRPDFLWIGHPTNGGPRRNLRTVGCHTCVRVNSLETSALTEKDSSLDTLHIDGLFRNAWVQISLAGCWQEHGPKVLDIAYDIRRAEGHCTTMLRPDPNITSSFALTTKKRCNMDCLWIKKYRHHILVCGLRY